MAFPPVTQADFIAAVAARSTAVNTYTCTPYVSSGSALDNQLANAGGLTIKKNGVTVYSLVFWRIISGKDAAATDANPSGFSVMIYTVGGQRNSVDAIAFLNTLN